MSYSVKEADGKWNVIKDGKIIATFDRQDQAWNYVDKKDVHPLHQKSSRWHWGRGANVKLKHKR